VFTVGFFLLHANVRPIYDAARSGWMGKALFVLALAAWAAVIAALQWLVARRQGVKIGWWLLASAASAAGMWLLEIALTALVLSLSPGGYQVTVEDLRTPSLRYLAVTLPLFALPIIVGAGQWLVLRRHISRAGWWVLACAVGEVLGQATIGCLSMALTNLASG
jgi:hypothetical protein